MLSEASASLTANSCWHLHPGDEQIFPIIWKILYHTSYPWLRYKSDHHTPLFRGADDGKAETSAPTCNKKTSCDTARVPRMCVFSRATLSVAFLLSSTCSQLEPNVSWKNARSVALIRRQPCSVAVAPKLSHLSHLFCF